MYRPACGIFVDDVAGEVVVAVRGTANMRDALVDLVCEPAQLTPGELTVGEVQVKFVHDGMWRSAQRLTAELQPALHAALEARPTHRLIITGHSLGAGVASLMCLLWRPLLGDRVACVAFASPQTLDFAAAHAAGDQDVTSVLVGDDVVPRLSLRSATDLLTSVVRLAAEELAEETTAATAATTTGSSRSTAEPRQSAPALFPAGRVLHAGAAAARASVADHEDFAAIRVSRSMILAHLQPSYLRALGEL